jgi:GNAT superfamily N-acetyltransferase
MNDNITPTATLITRPGTLDDIPMVVELLNTWSQASIGVNDADEADLRNEWRNSDFDPAIHTRLSFSPDGTLIAYGEVWPGLKPQVHPFMWGCVRPGFEGRGLASANIAWGETLVREIMKSVPEHLRFAPRVFTDARLTPARELYGNNNYRYLRSFYRMRIDMDAPPTAPVWPQGITLRTVRHPADDEAVYRAFDESFQDHFGHIEHPFETGFARFKRDMIEDAKHDPDLWFLALDGEALAALCLCRPQGYGDSNVGWINILAVRKPWRKRGLGQALLRHAFGVYYERGLRSVELGVDASSLTNAVRLYESVGMRVERKNDMYEKEMRSGEELSVQSL